jgi:hypothetical protein
MHRVVAGSKRGRQMTGAKAPSRSRSKYKPHSGAKEIERAERCYMVDTFPNGSPRCAPTMCQAAKPHA